MAVRTLTAIQIRRALDLRDLTDPSQGPHAIQLLVDAIEDTLSSAWQIDVRRERAHPVLSIEENYDRLLVPAESVSRDARYTRYLNDRTVLRTMTSTIVPPVLDVLRGPGDVLLSCPGIVYRRDAIDRLHTGEPHQLDLWRIRTDDRPLGPRDLADMIGLVVEAALPGRDHRTVPAEHPYTTDGLQIDVRDGDTWVEIGECGMANPALLRASGLCGTGLAMGLGLERLLMLRKGIDDIRLLRSSDPRVAVQMLDLEPWRPVSTMPPVRRDLSVAVADDVGAEDLGDRVRASLGPDASAVEEVVVLSETSRNALPVAARDRLGITAGQKNVLLRVVLRSVDRTLTDDEANVLRDRVYAAVHEGNQHEWAVRPVDGG